MQCTPAARRLVLMACLLPLAPAACLPCQQSRQAVSFCEERVWAAAAVQLVPHRLADRCAAQHRDSPACMSLPHGAAMHFHTHCSHGSMATRFNGMQPGEHVGLACDALWHHSRALLLSPPQAARCAWAALWAWMWSSAAASLPMHSNWHSAGSQPRNTRRCWVSVPTRVVGRVAG